MALGFVAVSLDVGGVLAAALLREGIAFDRSRFGVGHYLAMAAVDAAASAHEDFADYLDGFVAAIDVPNADRDRAHDTLADVLATPVWCQPLAGARDGVRALVDGGVRLAVTSNSDGTIADHLLRHEWLQVGPGPGALVEVITDSGVVGVGKPDPAMYEATVAGVCLPPEAILHVGDSVHYDVDGATACGLQSVHMDPYGLCAAREHAHVRRLAEVVDLR